MARRIRLYIKPATLGLLVGLLIAVISSAISQEIYDPPAIRFFPEHNTIGAELSIKEVIEIGRHLFTAKFNRLDGAGRPAATGDSKPTPRKIRWDMMERIAGPDASACSSCHNQPTIGGAGDFVANVFVGAHFSDPPVKRTNSSITSERNTTSLFGAGALEILAREMTNFLHSERDSALKLADTKQAPISQRLQVKGVDFGWIIAHPEGYIDYSRLEGVDYDLVVRPFGAKGVAASLREFTIAALNQHHGIQAVERFGWERTGRRDFDEDGVEVELTVGQVTALVLFQAALPAPKPFDPTRNGFEDFVEVGCAACHKPALQINSNIFSEPNPYNRPGTLDSSETDWVVELPLSLPERGNAYLIAAFTDLKRHIICDNNRPYFCNEMKRQDNVPVDEFMTTPLWNLATTAPYCHRGDCATVTEAILAHGGEATESVQSFNNLPVSQRRELVEFLLSLGENLGGP